MLPWFGFPNLEIKSFPAYAEDMENAQAIKKSIRILFPYDGSAGGSKAFA